MTTRFSIVLIICALYASGCLGQASHQPVATEATPAETEAQPTVADLHLSLTKSVYGPDEPIPVDMTIQTGKFDLLVPYATVEEKGAFTKLVVKNAMGEVVPPKRPITFVRKIKTLMRKGREVSCVQGVELKAGATQSATLDNLQDYYGLKPGDYTLQVAMNLEVYRESLADQSQQILEIEQSIASIQSDPKLPADAKQDAVNQLRDEIEFLRSNAEEQSDQIYLPLDSLRGSADLESNVVALTIQGK